MTTEESALQVDWRSKTQEPDGLADQPAGAILAPHSSSASDAEPETSVLDLSAVLIIILLGMAMTFAAAAILVFLTAHG